MSKRKILIIDDEEGFSEMVKLNLESTGVYEVKIETDPRRAVHEAFLYHPDLVLLDIIMAKKEGPEVAAEMIQDPILKKIPIVFLTATVTQQEVDQGDGVIGGHAFVAKPSGLNTLLRTIERNLVLV
jgi:CheY-like chemotaxis protein